MDLRPVGGIFWRLDASGNLTAYDTTGTVLAKFSGSAFSSSANFKQAGSGSGVSITSSSYVSLGSGGGFSFTNRLTQSFIWIVTGAFQSSVAGDTVSIGLYRTSGAIPAFNAPATGTFEGEGPILTAAVAGSILAYCSTAFTFDGAIVVNTAYNYYLAAKRTSGTGNVQANAYSLIVWEN